MSMVHQVCQKCVKVRSKCLTGFAKRYREGVSWFQWVYGGAISEKCQNGCIRGVRSMSRRSRKTKSCQGCFTCRKGFTKVAKGVFRVIQGYRNFVKTVLKGVKKLLKGRRQWLRGCCEVARRFNECFKKVPRGFLECVEKGSKRCQKAVQKVSRGRGKGCLSMSKLYNNVFKMFYSCVF